MAESNSPQGGWLGGETLPEKLLGPGRLHLWPPLGHTLAKVYRRLQDGDWVREVVGNRSVVVRLDEDHLSDLFVALSEVLTNRRWRIRVPYSSRAQTSYRLMTYRR